MISQPSTSPMRTFPDPEEESQQESHKGDVAMGQTIYSSLRHHCSSSGRGVMMAIVLIKIPHGYKPQ
jgi:hypothetical protein